ncbi:hypothetical protein [Escherichia phage vB_EcoM_JNE01]|nr:hypothetical protein [Escherichia phage vB_EcoM_JNE01]
MICANVFQDTGDEYNTKLGFLSFPVLPPIGATLNLTINGHETYFKVIDIEYCAKLYERIHELAIPVDIDIIVKEDI